MKRMSILVVGVAFLVALTGVLGCSGAPDAGKIAGQWYAAFEPMAVLPTSPTSSIIAYYKSIAFYKDGTWQAVRVNDTASSGTYKLTSFADKPAMAVDIEGVKATLPYVLNADGTLTLNGLVYTHKPKAGGYSTTQSGQPGSGSASQPVDPLTTDQLNSGQLPSGHPAVAASGGTSDPKALVTQYYTAVVNKDWATAYKLLPDSVKSQQDEATWGETQAGYGIKSFKITSSKSDGTSAEVVVSIDTANYGTFSNAWTLSRDDGGWHAVTKKTMMGGQ
jgi:hypothetical protein